MCRQSQLLPCLFKDSCHYEAKAYNITRRHFPCQSLPAPFPGFTLYEALAHTLLDGILKSIQSFTPVTPSCAWKSPLDWEKCFPFSSPLNKHIFLLLHSPHIISLPIYSPNLLAHQNHLEIAIKHQMPTETVISRQHHFLFNH